MARMTRKQKKRLNESRRKGFINTQAEIKARDNLKEIKNSMLAQLLVREQLRRERTNGN